MVHSKSTKLKDVCLSTAEAELRGLKEMVMDALWAKYYFYELEYPINTPLPIFEDSSAVVALVDTLKSQARTRHLNKIRMYIIQQIARHRVKVLKIEGKKNCADLLTKVLGKTEFLEHRRTILGDKDD